MSTSVFLWNDTDSQTVEIALIRKKGQNPVRHIIDMRIAPAPENGGGKKPAPFFDVRDVTLQEPHLRDLVAGCRAVADFRESTLDWRPPEQEFALRLDRELVVPQIRVELDIDGTVYLPGREAVIPGHQTVTFAFWTSTRLLRAFADDLADALDPKAKAKRDAAAVATAVEGGSTGDKPDTPDADLDGDDDDEDDPDDMETRTASVVGEDEVDTGDDPLEELTDEEYESATDDKEADPEIADGRKPVIPGPTGSFHRQDELTALENIEGGEPVELGSQSNADDDAMDDDETEDVDPVDYSDDDEDLGEEGDDTDRDDDDDEEDADDDAGDEDNGLAEARDPLDDDAMEEEPADAYLLDDLNGDEPENGGEAKPNRGAGASKSRGRRRRKTGKTESKKTDGDTGDEEGSPRPRRRRPRRRRSST